MGATVRNEMGAIYLTSPEDGLKGDRIYLDVVSIGATINTILASAQDEETAEAAGEAILPHLKQLDDAAKQFSSLPKPEPQLEQQIMAWFGEREHIMEEMAKQVERLEQEDPAFFGSQTLISSIIMLGGVLGGAQ